MTGLRLHSAKLVVMSSIQELCVGKRKIDNSWYKNCGNYTGSARNFGKEKAPVVLSLQNLPHSKFVCFSF